MPSPTADRVGCTQISCTLTCTPFATDRARENRRDGSPHLHGMQRRPGGRLPPQRRARLRQPLQRARVAGCHAARERRCGRLRLIAQAAVVVHGLRPRVFAPARRPGRRQGRAQRSAPPPRPPPRAPAGPAPGAPRPRLGFGFSDGGGGAGGGGATASASLAAASAGSAAAASSGSRQAKTAPVMNASYLPAAARFWPPNGRSLQASPAGRCVALEHGARITQSEMHGYY